MGIEVSTRKQESGSTVHWFAVPEVWPTQCGTVRPSPHTLKPGLIYYVKITLTGTVRPKFKQSWCDLVSPTGLHCVWGTLHVSLEHQDLAIRNKTVFKTGSTPFIGLLSKPTIENSPKQPMANKVSSSETSTSRF
ncbi:hypothetical protein J6590_069051 [Homalodisca vitripennis]|nr:hypothetical protein J6590_069051 [Homalodisca vitripennis]